MGNRSRRLLQLPYQSLELGLERREGGSFGTLIFLDAYGHREEGIRGVMAFRVLK